MRSRLAVSLLLCVACAALSQVGEAQDRLSRVRRAERPIADQYIVVLAPGADADALASEAEVRHGGRRKVVFRQALQGFSIRMTGAEAERFAHDPRVRFIEQDGVVEVAQTTSWGLDRLDQRMLPLDGAYQFAGLGANVTVHVIDTGIRASHADFGGRASVFADYVDDDGNPLTDISNDDASPGKPDGVDCHGHGTHVAGTIGGATYGVAKGVTLLAHRVFDCTGEGATSGVIAAVDAITATSERPAVVNMSLTGEPSDALDDAIRQSIASGVSYVVAAGNQNRPAVNYSPARVTEAITVGATDTADARASFSNYGSVVDLFAPGVNVVSASNTSDSGARTLSGTSMSAPHVAGIAALLLEENPVLTPAAVELAVIAAATPHVVGARGTGSPNRLLFWDGMHRTAPAVTLQKPGADERVLSGLPYTVRWNAIDPDGLNAFDVRFSTGGGAPYQPVPGCTALPASARECVWDTPSPVTETARVRVVARDSGGDEAFSQPDASFAIVQAADLVVSAIAAPPSPIAPGASFVVSDTVRNAGNIDAVGSRTRYYLSADGQKSADDVRLTGTRVVGAIPAGAETSGTATVSVASTIAAGTFTLFACADDTALVAETDENNNCMAAAAPVRVELPDLVLATLGSVPAAAAPGAAISVGTSISNEGTTAAPASVTGFYLSVDTLKDANDRVMSGTRSIGALAAGASSSVGTTSVTVPSSTPLGAYYLIACADHTGAVREARDDNNCTTSSTTVSIARPDLVTTSIGSPPGAKPPGGTFSLTASVQNLGPVAAAASTLRFYVSSDTVRGSGDLLLSGTRAVGALAAGSTSGGTTSVTLPPTTPPGTYYLLACADDLLKVSESDEANCRPSSTTMQIARPDLRQVTLADPPAVTAPGATFKVTDSVNNTSAVTAAASATRFYLSIDGIRNSADIRLSGTRSVPSLAANATSTGSVNVTVPANTGLATYRLLACADDTAAVTEADESNNCREAAGAVGVTLPDLVTAAVGNPPLYAATGGTFSLSDTVVNEGEYTAGASTTRYYLSSDALKDSSDVRLTGTRAVAALKVNESSSGKATLTVPATMTHGRYVILACADDLSKVGEFDDSNNCWASRDLVIGPPNARPVASAGSDSVIALGVAHALDGTGSTDADGDPLSYQWTLLHVPPGSGATLSDTTSATPEFTADTPGQYVVQLVVSDGREFSLQDAAIFTIGPATRFVAIGDTGLGDAGQYAGAALMENTCERSGCDFVVMLGDNIYPSGVESATDAQFSAKFELPYAGIDVPFYVVLGNHDYGNDGVGDEFHKGQFEVDYTAHSSKWRMPSQYYRFSSDAVELFGLDTNMQTYGQDANQRLAVADWLAASTAPWKIVLGHHPYRSNGGHGNATGGVASFMEQVVCGNADLLLSGHDHNLQWLQPTADCGGTELIVSGAGAKPKFVYGPSSPRYNPVRFQAEQLGFVYIVVTAQQLTAEFVGANGETLYVRTLTKAP